MLERDPGIRHDDYREQVVIAPQVGTRIGVGEQSWSWDQGCPTGLASGLRLADRIGVRIGVSVQNFGWNWGRLTGWGEFCLTLLKMWHQGFAMQPTASKVKNKNAI